MKSVDIPGVGTVDFPDEMSDKDIGHTIDKEIMPQVAERKRIDDYWSGRQAEEDSRPGYFSNLARGAGERVLDLAAGGLRSVGQLAEEGGDWLERRVPLGTVGSPGTPMTEEQIRADTVPLTGWAKDLAGTDLGYEPRTTWQDVKESPVRNFIPFAFEQGVTSIPDAAAAVFAPGAYAAARTGEIAQARAENDGRQSATVDDLMRAAPSAAASALLERFGAHGMMGLGDDAVRSFGQLPAAMGRAAAKEGATEFGQEVSDYLGETLGTRKGSTVPEALERGLAGAVGGAPFGGGVRGLTGTIQVWAQSRGVEPTQENLQAAAMTGDTAALDILRTAGMSDEQITSLSPEAAERFAARVEARRAADAAREAPDAIVPDAAPAPIDPVFTPGMTGPERRLAVQEAERLTAERDAGLQAKQLERNTVRGSQQRAKAEAERLDAEIDRRRVEEEGLKDGTIDPAAVSRRASRVMTPPPPEPSKVTEARARIAEILRMPGDRTTPDLAMEYVRLNGEVTRHDELTRQGTTRLGDLEDRLGSRMTEGTAAADPGLERATELRGRPNMPAVVDAPYRPHTAEEVAHQQNVMRRRQRAAEAPAAAIRDAEGGLPVDLEGRKAEEARIAAENRATGVNQMFGSEQRQPQNYAEMLDQRKAEQAFRLAAGKQGPIPGKEDLVTGQRLRAGAQVRDTRAGGRPEGGIDSQQTIHLDEGRPVEILSRRTVPNSKGEGVTMATVRRYNPRTDPPTLELDENGEAFEYEVPEAKLTQSKYAVDPRQAQQFEEKGGALTAKVAPYVVEPHRDARGKIVESDAVGRTVKPEAAGQRIDAVQGPQDVLKPGLPRQTYRTTDPDPTVPGAEGPTSELPGQGPVPRAPRPDQGTGGDYDYKSGGRGPNMRGDQTSAEANARAAYARAKAAAEAEARRRAKMHEEARANRTRDEKTGEQTEWGKTRSKYESRTDGYSAKPKGVDEDGWPHVDEDGFVLSDKGGPIRFENKQAMIKRLKEMRVAHPDAGIVPAPHPGPMKKTGMSGAESYWTLQATQVKPPPQPEQEQAAPEQDQEQASPNQDRPAAPSLPAEIGPQFTERNIRDASGREPGRRGATREAPFTAPETPWKDTGKTPETPSADTENTPVRNPEQLVAGAEKALRDRQVKPNPKAIARHFGIDEGQAANVLATIAGRSDKVIRQARPSRKELAAALRPREGAEAPAPKGPRYRLAPQFDEDMSLLEFLMSKGGLERDGDLVAMDAHRKSHPRYGNLVRKQGGGGLTLDEARELAEGEGYIGGTDDYNTTTIPDLLEAIEEELRGTRVTTERAGSGSEREQMEARARELGIDVNLDWNDAELMVEIGEADAIANEDNPTAQAADDLREVVDAMLVEMGIVPDTYSADFDIPFGDERDAGSDQGAGEVDAEAEGAAETAVDGAGRQAPDVRPGGRAAASGTGDAQEAGRERREPRVEKTDQGDQYVLPGEVGDLSGAETLKGKGSQKRADEGLFAEKTEPEPEQIDLEDAIAKAKAEPKAVTVEERIAALKAEVPAATGELARRITELNADLPEGHTLRTGVTKDGTLMVSVRDEAGDRVAYLTMSRGEGADGKPAFDIDYVENELGEPGLGTWLYKRAALEAIRRGADGLLVGGIASGQAEGAHGRLRRDGWLARELDVKSGDNLLVAPPSAKPEAEPAPAPEPDVPAKGTHRKVDGVDVVATGNPDYPWAGGRHVESGPNAGWQPDRKAGQGSTPEEAAAEVQAGRQRDDADRTKHTDATNRWNAAVKAAKSGEMPPAALLKGATRYGDGRVTTREAQVFLQDMGLSFRQTNKVVDQTPELDVTSGGARLYDLARIVRTGQNVLDVAKVIDDVLKTVPPKAETKPRKPPKQTPKQMKEAVLVSSLFGGDPRTVPTLDEDGWNRAAWTLRLEALAPRADTIEDVAGILDSNVAMGILGKETADGIKAVLSRMPAPGLKGLRLLIQDRLTPDEHALLGTNPGVLGQYLDLNPGGIDMRVLTVSGVQGPKAAVRTFIHENAHTLFSRISEPDKAAARRIYDGLIASRHALTTNMYAEQDRFEEWFAESMADHYIGGLQIPGGVRGGVETKLTALLNSLYKRIVDLFSGEKAQVDAFFSGLEASLGRPAPLSVDGIIRREQRGVSTLAILSNPIGALTGDWKAWRSGYQELARDVTEAWKSPRPNRQNAAAGLARWFFYSADGEYRAAIGKFNSPTLNMLADTFHAKAGSRHGLDSKLAGKLGMKLSGNATFDESVTRKVGIELNQLSRILEPFEQDAAAMDRIVDLVQKPASRRSDPESKAAGEIARQLASLHKYMTDSGVDVGQVKNGYFPREIDVAAVIKNHAGFVTQATKAYQSSGLGAKEAKEAADRWLTTVLFGGSGSPVRDAKGGSPNFVQSRVLTKQADEILKEFYQRDPGMVLGSYVSRAVKRAEIARRFGDNWKNWENIEKQIREEDPAAAGMLDLVSAYAATAAGVRQDAVSGLVRQGSSMVRTVTSVSLLEKSTLTSLGEAVMPAIRTGSLLDVIPTIGKTLREFRRDLAHMPPSVAAELAADIGAIAGSGVNSLMAARFAGGDPLGRGQARVLSKYFRRIGQEQWTNATRVAATERGAIFIRRLAGDIAGKGWSPKASRVYMEEMGVPAGRIDQFVKYVNGFGNDLPTPSDLDKGGEMGAAYRTALLRFVDQAIMRPTTTTKPRWASHPVGAVLFQLQAFNYVFAKNTVLRNLQLAKTAATPSADLDMRDRLALAYPVIMMLPLLGFVQFVVGDLIRDRLFMDPERRKAQTAAARIEKVISRTGLLGALDPYVQMVSGARYQKDPISTLTGPFLGVLGSGLGALQQYVGNNSPNTNAAERKATEALYDTLFEPMANIVLGYSPASPLATLVTMGLIPGLRDDFVDSVAGPRIGHKQQPIYGVTEILAGKQFKDKAGSWAAGG